MLKTNQNPFSVGSIRDYFLGPILRFQHKLSEPIKPANRPFRLLNETNQTGPTEIKLLGPWFLVVFIMQFFAYDQKLSDHLVFDDKNGK